MKNIFSRSLNFIFYFVLSISFVSFLSFLSYADDSNYLKMLRDAGLNISRSNDGGYFLDTPVGPVDINTHRILLSCNSDNRGSVKITIQKPVELQFVTVTSYNVTLKQPISTLDPCRPYQLGLNINGKYMEGMYFDIPADVNNQPPLYNSNYVGFDNPLYNWIMQSNRRVEPSPEALQFLQDIQTSAAILQTQNRSDEEILRQSAERIKKILGPYYEHPLKPYVSQPEPLPPGYLGDSIRSTLKPLNNAMANASPIQGAKTIARILQTIQLFSSFPKNKDHELLHKEANYLKRELFRQHIDSNGFLKGLIYAKAPAFTFMTKIFSDDGLRIRNNINSLLAVEEVSQFTCNGLEGQGNTDLKETCSEITSLSNELKAAHLIADRLSWSNEKEAFNDTIIILEAVVQKVTDFAGGFGSGGVASAKELVKGVGAIISHPIQAAIWVWNAVTHLDNTWDLIKSSVSQSYETVLNGTAEEVGDLVGKLTINVLTTVLGPGTVLNATRAGPWINGIKLAATRAAAETALDIAYKGGKLTASALSGMKGLASAVPNIAKRLVTESKDFRRAEQIGSELDKVTVRGYQRAMLSGSENAVERVVFEAPETGRKLGQILADAETNHVADYVGKAARAEEHGSKIYKASELADNAESFVKIEGQAAKESGIAAKATETRGIKKFLTDAEGIVHENKLEDVFKMHEGNITGNHRFSMPGEKAMYSATGENAVETILAETGKSLDELIIGTREVAYKKLLDLTDPKVIERLGIKLDDLIKPEEEANAYRITHMIGDIANKYGFDGIKTYSAKMKKIGKDEINIVELKK